MNIRRISIHRPGGHDRLLIEPATLPPPSPGETSVAVEAAGVNYADCIVRMGLYASAKKYVGWPITPGFEVCGRVAALGDGVDGPEVGTPVLALCRFGGYASGITVPSHQVFALPEGLESPAAAGFAVAHLTAYYGLHELARVRPGSIILVHSAAGGVGSALLQLGKIMGARVVGVVGSTHKILAARELGADEVIDRSTENLWAAAEKHAPGGYDVVLDASGYTTLRQSYRHLRPTGRLISYGFHSMMPRRGGRPRWGQLIWGLLRTPRFNPIDMTSHNRSVMAFNLSTLFEERDLLTAAMKRLLDWFAAGDLRLPTVTTYPLEHVADAHRDLESAQTVGKLILEMADGA